VFQSHRIPGSGHRDAVIFEAGKFASVIERLTAALIAQSSSLYDDNAQLGLRESPGGDQPYDAATHDTYVEGLGDLCVAFKVKKQNSTKPWSPFFQASTADQPPLSGPGGMLV